MRLFCATLLLIFGIGFGWQQHADHQRAIERAAVEERKGYENCIAPLDQANALDRMGSAYTAEVNANWLKARGQCSTFWFRHCLPDPNHDGYCVGEK